MTSFQSITKVRQWFSKGVAGCAMGALATMPLVVNANILIDDFSTDQALIFSVGAPSSAASFVSGAVIGGEREIVASVNAGSVASVEVTGGKFSFSLAAGTAGSGTVAWDGPDNLAETIDPVGLGGLDLTSAGTLDGFLIAVTSADTSGTVIVQVFTDGANASSFSAPVGVIASPATLFLPFSSFSTSNGTGANFSNVGAIQLEVQGNALDIVVSNIEVAASLTVSQTDALLIDNDFDALASPGDTVRYTATVSNPDDLGNASAPGVMYDVAAPANAALVVGSVTTSQGTVATGNTGGDSSVSVNVGSIADASSVTITYDVLIDSPLDIAATQLSAQAAVTSTSLTGDVLSDDPSTPAETDATLTPLSKTVISGTVFNDSDNDGNLDMGELGIAGVTLDIYSDLDTSSDVSGGDTLLRTVTTDGNGEYEVVLANVSNFVVDLTDTGAIVEAMTLTTGQPSRGLNVSQGGSKTGLNFAYNSDADADGADSAIENQVPNATNPGLGDGNGDNIQDSTQNHVASLRDNANTGFLTLETDGALSLSAVTAQAIPADVPANAQFPSGFVSFVVNGVTPGADVDIEIYVPYNPAINGYLKKNGSGDWVDISTDVSHINTDKTKVTIRITEGGEFDTDSDSSTITDPGGPAIITAAALGAAQAVPVFNLGFAYLLAMSLLLLPLALRKKLAVK